MKVCLFFVLGIAFFNAFAFGQNATDFETLRALIREDTRAIVKEEIAASEKRTRAFVTQEIAKLVVRMDERDRRVAAELQAINTRIDDTNSRFNGVDNRLSLNLTLLVALLGLIGVALGLPYLQDKKKERAQEEKIAIQQQQIEAQQQQLAAQQQMLETQQQRMDAMEEELKTLKQDRVPST